MKGESTSCGFFLEATHERGIEAFFSHRMNGGDNDPMYVPGVGTIMDGVVQGGGEIGDAPSVNRVPLKEEHPDWLFHTSWSTNGWWNYAVEGVRDHLLTRLLEVAEGYDFRRHSARLCPGLSLSRGPGLAKPGQADRPRPPAPPSAAGHRDEAGQALLADRSGSGGTFRVVTLTAWTSRRGRVSIWSICSS